VKKGNKGQFYILTAIVLCSIVFAFATRVADISAPYKKSEFLYENYMQEAYIALNSAILDSKNASERFILFTDDYTEYARTVDSNFSEAVILKSDNLLILNRFLVPINFSLYSEVEKFDDRAWNEIGVGGSSNSLDDDYMDLRIGKRTFTLDLRDLKGEYAITGIYLIDRKFYKFRQVG